MTPIKLPRLGVIELTEPEMPVFNKLKDVVKAWPEEATFGHAICPNCIESHNKQFKRPVRIYKTINANDGFVTFNLCKGCYEKLQAEIEAKRIYELSKVT